MIYHIFCMRIPKTFTIDDTLLEQVERSRGKRSVSERVNALLKRALALEQKERLEREAAEFYAAAHDRTEETAFQKAAARTLARN